jgi:hypothetical protein
MGTKAFVIFDFPELGRQLPAQKGRIAGFEPDAIWRDMGRRDDYAATRDVFEQNQDQFRMAGRPGNGPAEPM